MRPLATQFTVKNFTYTQLTRTPTMALYEQRHLEHGRLTYEVIRVLHYKANTFPNGTVAPDREGYPPASLWGSHGWTCYTQIAAEALLASRLTGKGESESMHDASSLRSATE